MVIINLPRNPKSIEDIAAIDEFEIRYSLVKINDEPLS
ncbi:hypothetical protein Vi05172_g2631 [Venturia inaequalis]|nr:hypothetical protein Vi05172_g2631 [Venturia inaequalis]